MAYDDLYFRIHALERMLEHDVSELDVREALEQDQIIETLTDQYGMTKNLYLGLVEGRPIHVATVDDDDGRRTEILTVYVPDLDRWKPGFRTRRTR